MFTDTPTVLILDEFQTWYDGLTQTRQQPSQAWAFNFIQILVDLFKNADNAEPIITAADFSLTNEKSAVASLLDSVANQQHKDLREKAIRNLQSVRDVPAGASTFSGRSRGDASCSRRNARREGRR